MSNRNLIIGAALSGVVLTGAVIAVVLSGTETPEKKDLSSIHSTVMQTQGTTVSPAAPETTSPAPSTPAETETAPEDVQGLSVASETYQQDNLSIKYPQLKNMADAERQSQINRQIKDNALAVLNSPTVKTENPVLDISYSIPSINRSRISIIYTGYANAQQAAHPVNLFYTNNIDLTTGKDLGLSDYADPYTMAGYLLSDDVVFDYPDQRQSGAVQEEIRAAESGLEYFTELLAKADFPLDAAGQWPDSFSYEKQGVIYFSVPLSHALGDYAIVKFTPATK